MSFPAMPRRLRAVVGALVAALLLPLGAGPAAAALPTNLRNTYSATIEGYAGYDPQTSCSGSVQPGIAAIADFLRSAFPTTNPWDYVRSCTSGGISEHKDGRAIDWMLDVNDPKEKAVADAFLAWVLATDKHGNTHAMARRMGIMYMVFNGKMWRAYRNQSTWDASVDRGHYDHIHISFSRAAAAKRTSFFGGTSAPRVPTTCVVGSASCPVARLSGADRYATAVAIGKVAAPRAGSVVLASGADGHLVDGLVAAPLAKALGAPLLLAGPTGLPPVVHADLRARQPARAYLVGGAAGLGAAVGAQLRSLGITVTRIAGDNRYDTAAAVAQRLRAVRGKPLTRAVIAAGADANLVDALGAAGPAAAAGHPILLAGAGLPAPTRLAIDNVGVTGVNLIGSTAVVPPAVESSLTASGRSVRRLAGADRYATAARVAAAYSAIVAPATVTVASGADANLVDALPAGALGRLTVLSQPGALPGASAAFLRDAAVTRAQVVGGPSALGQAVVDAVGVALR